MTEPRPISRREALHNILQELCQDKGIEAVYLTGEDGLHIASVVPPGQPDPDELMGRVARMQRAAAMLQSQMGWRAVSEVCIRSDSRHLLVARSARIRGERLTLVALVAPGRRYRRLMARALRSIGRAWQRR